MRTLLERLEALSDTLISEAEFIQSVDEKGDKFWTATNKGISYTLIPGKVNGGYEWCLWARDPRRGNRINPPKCFNSLEEIEKKIKGFRGISKLINKNNNGTDGTVQ